MLDRLLHAVLKLPVLLAGEAGDDLRVLVTKVVEVLLLEPAYLAVLLGDERAAPRAKSATVEMRSTTCLLVSRAWAPGSRPCMPDLMRV